MNPESSSYGETLHEDSFEYHGEMMLMQEFDPDAGYQGHGQIRIADGMSEGWDLYYQWDGNHYEMFKDKPTWGDSAYDWNYFHVIPGQGEYTTETKTTGVSVEGGMGDTEFTYKDGEFAPTLEEYRESVSKYGYDEVAAGMGGTGADYDEFYGKPLEKLSEDLKFAGIDYRSGLHDLGLKTGQSLFDINKQAGRQMSISGMESSGSVDFAKARAGKSVFGEYKSQQTALETAKAKAISDIGFREDEFWKADYDKWWDETGDIDLAGGFD